LRGKSIGGKSPARRFSRASAEWGGPIKLPFGRPYIGIPLFLGKERLARPVQEREACLMVFRATSFLPGRAMPEIQ